MRILKSGTFNGRTITEADLDRLVANSPTPIPVTGINGDDIGHAQSLRRTGDTLECTLIASLDGVIEAYGNGGAAVSTECGFDDSGSLAHVGRIKLFAVLTPGPLADEPAVVQGGT